MKKLLELSDYISPYNISEKKLNQILTKDQIVILKKNNILNKAPYLNYFECPDCFDQHEIVFQNNESAFINCHDSEIGRYYLDIDEIMQWSFNIFNLIILISERLKISSDIKEIIENEFWGIGHINNQYKLFYSCSYRLFEYQEVIKNIINESSIKNTIILTNTKKPLIDKIDTLVVLPICDIISVKSKGIAVSKKIFNQCLEYFIYTPIKKDNIKMLECRGLKLILKEGTLQYKHNDSVEINLKTKPIRLLKTLMINKNCILKYKDIAYNLKLTDYHDDLINIDIARDIQLIMKELKQIIKQTGLSNKEISNIIRVKRSTGYKMIG